MTVRRLAVVALVACLDVAWPAAQPASSQRLVPADSARETPAAVAPDPSPVSIRINAVVTDRLGRPLTDLKAADFELDDGGVGQTLQSVELRTVAAGERGADVPPVLSDADELEAARQPDTRVIAMFLDEFNVSPGANSARVREAASRFLAEYVRPRDLVYVMKPLGPVTGLRFTRDRTAARAAIEAFEGRKGDYAPRTPFEAQYFGRAPAAVDGARAQIVTTGLRELTMKIGELRPARPALVLVSEGFVRTLGDRRRLPDWQSLARAASHFNLPIYALDPRDRPVPDPEAADGPSGADRGLTTLQSLAAQTGGEAVTDARELLPSLARISRDLDTYYVLTYQPSKATDGRFHPIEVRTTRKAAQVRVPSGYWSPLSNEWRTWLDRAVAPAAPVKPVRVLRRSQLIDTWIGFERDEAGRLSLMFTWEATPAGAALRARPRTVELKVSTLQGVSLFEREVDAVMPGGAAGTSDRAVFPVAAGRMQIDLSIRGADGSVLDTSAQDVDVPAVRGAGPVLLQPQIVRARTARDFRALSASADAAPTPSRVFSRSERLIVRVPAYNPDGAPVTPSVSVSNGQGHLIRTLAQISGAAGGPPQFELPLAFLAPGEYGIDIKVASPTGNVRQLIRFRLTG